MAGNINAFMYDDCFKFIYDALFVSRFHQLRFQLVRVPRLRPVLALPLTLRVTALMSATAAFIAASGEIGDHRFVLC